jgi:cytochrome c oxidase subunit 4
MSDSHAHDIDRDVRIYVGIFVSLMVLTLVTVGAWKFLDLPVVPTIAIALFIASVKGALVAGFFMHLISEKKLIYWVLALTVVFFFTLLLLPVLTSLADQAATG